MSLTTFSYRKAFKIHPHCCITSSFLFILVVFCYICGQFREQGAINQGSSPEGTPTLKGIYTWRTRSHYWHTAVTEGSCPLSASQLRSWSEADMVEMGASLGPTEKWMTCSPEPLSSPALSRSAQLPDWKSSLLKT